MHELIEKRLKAAKVCLIATIVLGVAFLGAIALISVLMEDLGPEVCVPVVMIFGWGFFICLIVYFTKYFAFTRSVRRLSDLGLEHIADDVNLERPTLFRSKIYCGEKAFFCKKPYVILPYGDVLWAYLYERRVYGIPVEKSVILFTRYGKKFQINAHPDEFKWMLERYIIPQSPELILGYGGLQAQRYKQLKQAYKEK